MRAARPDLIKLKRSLLAARARLEDAINHAGRAGEADLEKRLQAIADRLSNELDYLNTLLRALP